MPEAGLVTQEKPIGVIDALSTGYRLLFRRMYVAVVPFLVDLFFWLGPRVTPWEAFRTLLRQADPELRIMIERATGLDVLAAGPLANGPNVLTGLVQGPGAPGSLAAALGTLPPPPGWTPHTIAPSSPWALIGLVVVLLVVGTPLAAFYLTLAFHALVREGVVGVLNPSTLPQTPTVEEWSQQRPGEDVRKALLQAHYVTGESAPFPFWRIWAWTTANLLVFIVLILLFMVMAIVGLSLAAVASMFVSPALAVGMISVGTVFISWLMLLGMLFFYFTPASIVAYQANVFRSMVSSARLVFRYLWSSIGLVLISMVITEGFALIWRSLFSSVPGMLISIGGNAILTSGLTLGAFIFLVDRLGWLIKETQQQSAS